MTQPTISLLKDSEQIQGISQVYFAAHYRAANPGQQDNISQEIRDFKRGIEPQTSRWISLVAPLICSAGPFDVIVRALGSSELAAQGTCPLNRLCEAIAQQSGAMYAPELLEKSRTTRVLQGLGGRAAHRKELAGAYTFQGSAIKPGSRVLVVDDIMSTGSTLEAVGCAIRENLANAEIVGFVLGKAGTTSKAHFETEHFVATEEGSMAERKATKNATNPSPRKRSRGKVSAQKSRKPLLSTKAPAPAVKRKPPMMVYVLSIVFVFVILGAIVPLRSGKNTSPLVSTLFEPLPPPTPVEPVAVAPTKELRAPAVRKNLHPAVVTIPSVGLRTTHSLASKTVLRAAVHNGERVEIINRYSNSGPGWLQVRTKTGKVGWVFASVVKEQKVKEL